MIQFAVKVGSHCVSWVMRYHCRLQCPQRPLEDSSSLRLELPYAIISHSASEEFPC